MNIAMMGLIQGFAQGTSDRITREREEEKTLIANRLKMAALNKKQREEEAGSNHRRYLPMLRSQGAKVQSSLSTTGCILPREFIQEQ